MQAGSFPEAVFRILCLLGPRSLTLFLGVVRMAQEKSKTKTKLSRLALRYGIRGRTVVAVAVVALVLVVGVVAVALAGGFDEGVFVERSDEEESTEELEDEADAADVTDKTDASDEATTDETAETAADAAAEADAEETTIVVHVDGAVAEPGVYELPSGSRANDAVIAAGGLLDDADTSTINLAATLSDGEKLYIPTEGEEVTVSTTSTSTTTSTSDDSSETELININTATAEELDELPGIGEATAAAIIEDRETNGEFTSIEDIMRVSGIGEAKFANIKDLICV